MRSLGMAEAPLAALDAPGALSAREDAAIRYTRAAMTDSNRVPEELFAELHGLFSDPELVELHLPGRVHQHAEHVQQPAAGDLPRRVRRRGRPAPDAVDPPESTTRAKSRISRRFHPFLQRRHFPGNRALPRNGT